MEKKLFSAFIFTRKMPIKCHLNDKMRIRTRHLNGKRQEVQLPVLLRYLSSQQWRIQGLA